LNVQKLQHTEVPVDEDLPHHGEYQFLAVGGDVLTKDIVASMVFLLFFFQTDKCAHHVIKFRMQNVNDLAIISNILQIGGDIQEHQG
jgi:hypothetical protein